MTNSIQSLDTLGRANSDLSLPKSDRLTPVVARRRPSSNSSRVDLISLLRNANRGSPLMADAANRAPRPQRSQSLRRKIAEMKKLHEEILFRLASEEDVLENASTVCKFNF